MKTTLIYKQADLFMQFLAFAIPAISGLLGNTQFEVIYFSVGMVQSLSCIINRIYLDSFFRNTTRLSYEYLLLCLAMITTAMFIYSSYRNDSPFGYGFFLLFFSPVMAIWYVGMTTHEMLVIKRMAHRKDYI